MALIQSSQGVQSAGENVYRLETRRATTGLASARLTRSALRATLAFAVMSSGCESTAPHRAAIWGSDQASVRIVEDRTAVQIMAAGGCYGAYGNIDQPVRSGTFALAGTYTQLIGAYPGSRQYSAEYDGSIVGNTMTLSISIPALPQTLGPFHLTAGVTSSWSPCLYPYMQ